MSDEPKDKQAIQRNPAKASRAVGGRNQSIETERPNVQAEPSGDVVPLHTLGSEGANQASGARVEKIGGVDEGERKESFQQREVVVQEQKPEGAELGDGLHRQHTPGQGPRRETMLEYLNRISKERRDTPELKVEQSDSDLTSDAEAPMKEFAERNLMDASDDGVLLIAQHLSGVVSFTDPAVMDRELVPKLNMAWAALFGATDRVSVSKVVSAICVYFAVNSTSSRIPPKEKISVLVAGAKVSVHVSRLVEVAFSVTGEREIRRVMRAYADFTRECLRQNPTVRTKMSQEFRIPQNFINVAFDFSDYCQNPPLSSIEDNLLSRAREKLIFRTAESDAAYQAD
jgi:hypothetical protein